MSAPKVVMYATDWCGYCARARRLLDAKGVQYEEIDVDLVPGARAEMQERSGRSSGAADFHRRRHTSAAATICRPSMQPAAWIPCCKATEP